MDPCSCPAFSGERADNGHEPAIIISSFVSNESEKISRISSSAGRSGALRIRGEGVVVGGSEGASGQRIPTQVGLWSVTRDKIGFMRPPAEVREKGVRDLLKKVTHNDHSTASHLVCCCPPFRRLKNKLIRSKWTFSFGEVFGQALPHCVRARGFRGYHDLNNG